MLASYQRLLHIMKCLKRGQTRYGQTSYILLETEEIETKTRKDPAAGKDN